MIFMSRILSAMTFSKFSFGDQTSACAQVLSTGAWEHSSWCSCNGSNKWGCLSWGFEYRRSRLFEVRKPLSEEELYIKILELERRLAVLEAR